MIQRMLICISAPASVASLLRNAGLKSIRPLTMSVKPRPYSAAGRAAMNAIFARNEEGYKTYGFGLRLPFRRPVLHALKRPFNITQAILPDSCKIFRKNGSHPGELLGYLVIINK